MKLRNNKGLKIATATGVTIFSLVAVFTSTIAWFVTRKNTNASGMNVVASEETGRLNKIELYELESLEPKTTYDQQNNPILVPNYSFNSTPSATLDFSSDDEEEFSTFSLGDYDPLNVEHPLLIIFSFNMEYLSMTAGDVYVKGSTQVSDFMGATENGAPKYNLGSSAPTLCQGQDEDNGWDLYPLSSAVNFKCTYYSSDDYDDLLDNSQTGRIDINPNDLDLNESFVNFVPASATIQFKKNPTIFSSPGKTNGEGTPIQYIAMVVNYDSNAVSAIYSTYLGNTKLEGDVSSGGYGGALHFVCDWALEVF